jgi:hypothetical protein
MTSRLTGSALAVGPSDDPFMGPSGAVSLDPASSSAGRVERVPESVVPEAVVPEAVVEEGDLPRPADRRRPARDAGFSTATPSMISGSLSEVFLPVMLSSGPWVDMAV